MSSQPVRPPYPSFYDASGVPLENGYVYIGTSGLNAESNQITVYWDSSLTTTALQPIRTIGGYPSRDGSPGALYLDNSTSGDYSIVVKDKNENQVYSEINATVAGSGEIFLDLGTQGKIVWVEEDPTTWATSNVLFWEAGDMAINVSPVANEPLGWICITDGIPGTWQPFGMHTQYVDLSSVGPTDDLNVAYSKTVVVDTSSNGVTIGGMTGGQKGDFVTIVKTSASNTLKIEDQELSASTDFLTGTGADLDFQSIGAASFVYTGSKWQYVNNSNLIGYVEISSSDEPIDDLDVTNIGVVGVVGDGVAIRIRGVTGGQIGQVIRFSIITNSGNVQVIDGYTAHGNQSFYTASGADETVTATAKGGWTFMYDGTAWRACN